MKKKLIGSMCLLSTVLVLNGFAGGHGKQGVEALSQDIRDLLTKEMVAIQEGMISMYPQMVAGDFEYVAQMATKIKKSFILKQNLTKEQKKELGKKLPAAFIALDREFHDDAGMLNVAANKKNIDLVNFYYSKMTKNCMSCHSQFAQKKFPAFKMSLKNANGGH